MISYEINVLCDGQFDFGQFGACEGCYTSEPLDTPNTVGALKVAISRGWTMQERKHFCPDCTAKILKNPELLTQLSPS